MSETDDYFKYIRPVVRMKVEDHLCGYTVCLNISLWGTLRKEFGRFRCMKGAVKRY